jgi:hypothetical protein
MFNTMKTKTAQVVLRNPDRNIATLRTGVNVGWIAAAVYVAQRYFNVTIDPADPVVLAVVPAVVAFGYRLSAWASDRWPEAGRVLFGYGTTPTYRS